MENFKGIPRRVKIDRKKTMFRNAKYIKRDIIRMPRRIRDVSTP